MHVNYVYQFIYHFDHPYSNAGLDIYTYGLSLCFCFLSPSALQLHISTATTSFCSGNSSSWWLWASSEQSPSLQWSGKQQLFVPVALSTAAFDLDTPHIVQCKEKHGHTYCQMMWEGEKIKLKRLRWRKLLLNCHQSNWTRHGRKKCQIRKPFFFNQPSVVCMLLKIPC